jgi:hypothetical protein
MPVRKADLISDPDLRFWRSRRRQQVRDYFDHLESEIDELRERIRRLEQTPQKYVPTIVTAKGVTRRLPVSPPETYSIKEFCAAHGISVTFYYLLRKRKPPQTPKEMRVGRRYFVSREAAADWRRERERHGG